MVRQSPERAYNIALFDEFPRAAGWTNRLSLENPDLRRQIDYRTISGRCVSMCAGDAGS
jgi:hypothetical protein